MPPPPPIPSTTIGSSIFYAIFCLFVVLQCSQFGGAFVAAQNNNNGNNSNLITVLVCEGGLASLHCPPQHVIAVHLANFGRFSLHTCNREMRMDLNTQCHNPRTIEVLRASCDQHQQCRVQASTEVFGPLYNDKCSGTSRVNPYLEASFKCVPSKVTTTTTTTTITTTLSTSAAAATSGTMELPFAGNLPFDGGGKVVSMEEEENDNDDGMDANAKRTTTRKGGKKSTTPTVCPARTARGLRWQRTPLGRTIHLPCPQGSRGQAEWYCSSETAGWMPAEGPNLSRCTSDWARELHEDLNEIGIETSREQRQNWLEVLREGHSHLRREELIGGDARLLGEVLAEVVRRLVRKRQGTGADSTTHLLVMADEHSGGGAEERRAQQQEALEFVRLIVDTIGHLLRPNQQAAWLDLGAEQRQALASQLLHSMPQTLSLLLPLPNWPKAGSESLLAEPTLVAEVAQASIYDYVPFPSMSLYRQNFDTVLLPREALQMFGQDLANVFYTAWDQSMGNHLLAGNNADEDGTDEMVITKVVGIWLVPLNGKLIPAKQIPSLAGQQQQGGGSSSGRPVVLTFQSSIDQRESGQFGAPRCAWWDPEAGKFVTSTDNNNNDDDDVEKEETAATNDNGGGCALAARNQTHIVCECRLVNTHFAVLAPMLRGSGGSNGRAAILLWRTLTAGKQLHIALFFAASLAAFVCLLITMLIQCALQQRPAERTKGEQIKCALTGSSSSSIENGSTRLASKCRRHICLVLLALELVLLLRMVVPEERLFCNTMAFCRDYLLLACLCWTAFDAIQLSRTIGHFSAHGLMQANKCQKCASLLRRCATFLCGFGIPLILISAISFVFPAANPLESAAAECWPQWVLRHNILFTFTGPASMLLVVTICCLARSFWTLRAGNLKWAQQLQKSNNNNNGKLFGSNGGNGYQPCSTTNSSTTTTTSSTESSSNSSANSSQLSGSIGNTTTKQQQRAERRLLGQLRNQLKWLCARVVLLAAGLSLALCWALQQQQQAGEGGVGGGKTALLVASAINLVIAVVALAEVLADKHIRASYRKWRNQRAKDNNGTTTTTALNIGLNCFLKPMDLLFCSCCGCCASSSSTSSSSTSAKRKRISSTTSLSASAPPNAMLSSTEFLLHAAKFAAHSPLICTPNTSSTTSRGGGGSGNSGIEMASKGGDRSGGGEGGGGAMSACSELSTTMEMQLSTGTENGSGGGSIACGGTAGNNNFPGANAQHHQHAANLYRPHPPPPAPLLQLYQEHKMLQQRNSGNSGGGGSGCCSPAQQQRANNSGSLLYNASQHHGEDPIDNGESIYEYATIPYEELLTAYHRQQQQQKQQQQQQYFHSGASVCCPSSPFLGNGSSSTTSTLGRPIATPRMNGNSSNSMARMGQGKQQLMMMGGMMPPYITGPPAGINRMPMPAAVRRSPGPPSATFAANNNNHQHSGTSAGGGAYPVRLSMVGQQQVALVPSGQQHYPAQFNPHGEMSELMAQQMLGHQQPNIINQHQWQKQQQHEAAHDLPPILEMGIHSAPPNFPPPPPPAPTVPHHPYPYHQHHHQPSPSAACSTFVDPTINFRRSSSGSLRSSGTTNSTLVLRMDLSRPKPVFSERIDSVADALDEEEDE